MELIIIIITGKMYVGVKWNEIDDKKWSIANCNKIITNVKSNT